MRKNGMRVVKFIEDGFDLVDFLHFVTKDFQSSYIIKIDFSFLIQDSSKLMSGYYLRYVFACRNCHINETTLVTNIQDYETMIGEISQLSYDEILQKTFLQHTEFGFFSKSGYTPRRLLSLNLFLTKFY